MNDEIKMYEVIIKKKDNERNVLQHLFLGASKFLQFTCILCDIDIINDIEYAVSLISDYNDDDSNENIVNVNEISFNDDTLYQLLGEHDAIIDAIVNN